MIKINKGIEPKTLTEYRNGKGLYEPFDAKNGEDCENNKKGNLRRQLLEEQGYVCCYCLTSIHCYNSVIEHFKAQSKYPECQLDYKNLFIACEGGKSTDLQCVKKKGNSTLLVINLLKNIEYEIFYKPNGEIYSENSSINIELENILNLNSSILISNRQASFNQFIQNFTKKYKGEWSKKRIEKEIKKYQSKNENGKHAAFYAMIIFFLKKRLKRM